MQSSDEYSDPHDDPSDDDYDPRPSSSLSTPTRRKTSPSKRASPAKGGSQAPMEPMKRTLSLYSLPAEIIDAILYEPTLRIHDHMALARTCRTLRAVYYTPPPAGNTYASFSSPVWAALVAQRPFEGQGRPSYSYPYTSKEKEKRLKHLWSDRFDESKMIVLGSKRMSEQRKWDRALSMYVVHPAKHKKMLIRSEEWTDAINDVAKRRITKTTAKQHYKLSDTELGRLHCIERPNPHHRGGAPMQLYVEAVVERVAYKLHGGYQGHLQVVKNLADRAAKANETRRAKAAGTWQPPTPQKTPKKSRKSGGNEDEPMPTPGWRQLTPPPIVLGGDDDDDEEAGSPTPGPSRAAAVAAPGPIHNSDNDDDNNDKLMFMEPKTPTRRPKKRAFEDEDEEDTIIFATPPPLSQQRQPQQLPTPLSPLGGVDPLSMAGAAGPSTPSPSARGKRRGRRRQPSSVKQETKPVGGIVKADEDSLLGLGTALKQEQVVKGGLLTGDDDDEVKPSLGQPLPVAEASGSAGPALTVPKFEGLPWLSPWSGGATVVVGRGANSEQDALGHGVVKKEDEEEQTLTRNDGRPARRGAKRDYSIYA